MSMKKIRTGLVTITLSLSLILGQGVALAADQGVPANSLEGVNSTPSIVQSTPNVSIASLGIYSILGNGVRIRAEANSSSTILGLLYQSNGDYIEVTAESPTLGWVYGKTSTGIWGWVASQYVAIY